MSLKIVLLSCVAAAVLADHPPPEYPPPPAYPPPEYPHPPAYPPPPPPPYHPPAPHKAPEYPEAPPKYTYNYGVADDYSGANFGHSESRDGYKTEGSYTVDLPDGRKQTVTYVDNGDGLIAEVTYEGEAQYPEHQAAYPPPPPSYPPPPPPPPPPAYEA